MLSSMRHRFAQRLAAAALLGGVLWGTRNSVEAQPRGKAVYDAHCVECHGPSGKGDGASAAYLVPRPRDFTAGKYKIRSTESGSVPSDDDLIASVRRGLYATAMPGWDRILSDADITDVVQYVKSLSPQFASQPPRPIALGDGLPSSPASIARGQQAYDKLQCGKCHGSDGRGTGAVTVAFEDDWRMPLRAADLTEPWTFHGGATSRDIYLRFRAGMTGTPMPSFADAASDSEMWDLANYVVSIARKPVWSMNAGEVQQFYARQEAQAKANPAKRGRQLVETLGCVLCHSPVDDDKRMLLQKRAAGKYHSGGLWTNACCTHPRQGETPLAAAGRRLREELGVDCPLNFVLRAHYRAEVGNALVENEVVHLFAGRYAGHVQRNPEEVDDFAWSTREALLAAIAERPQDYTYWFRYYLKAFDHEIFG